MNRFTTSKRNTGMISKFFPVFFCLLISCCFLYALSSISSVTQEQKLESLKTAVLQSTTSCYALEGFYPDQLQYLEEHYGLHYDKNKYFISYEVTGSNMVPDIMVIPRTEYDGG